MVLFFVVSCVVIFLKAGNDLLSVFQCAFVFYSRNILYQCFPHDWQASASVECRQTPPLFLGLGLNVFFMRREERASSPTGSTSNPFPHIHCRVGEEQIWYPQQQHPGAPLCPRSSPLIVCCRHMNNLCIVNRNLCIKKFFILWFRDSVKLYQHIFRKKAQKIIR